MEVLPDWRNAGAEVDPLAAAKWPSSNLSQCSGSFIIANEAATQLRNLKNYTENIV
ncbi:GM23198 [Drosophila sechellia]|uniref:GM23198 n=1 Tax=Drosophila sechellia TaxID=7238 RepID=B4IID4_DROSE|nr:GM23198 [Drosophila sechellia]